MNFSFDRKQEEKNLEDSSESEKENFIQETQLLNQKAKRKQEQSTSSDDFIFSQELKEKINNIYLNSNAEFFTPEDGISFTLILGNIYTFNLIALKYHIYDTRLVEKFLHTKSHLWKDNEGNNLVHHLIKVVLSQQYSNISAKEKMTYMADALYVLFGPNFYTFPAYMTKNNHNQTPLQIAAIESSKNIYHKSILKPLFDLIIQGHQDFNISYILKQKDSNDKDVIEVAIEANNSSFVKYLIDNIENITVSSKRFSGEYYSQQRFNGQSILQKYIEILHEKTIANIANKIEAIDGCSLAKLFFADRKDVLQLLVSNKINLATQDEETGNNVLHILALQNYKKPLPDNNFFQTTAVDVNAENLEGYTPLDVAFKTGNWSFISNMRHIQDAKVHWEVLSTIDSSNKKHCPEYIKKVIAVIFNKLPTAIKENTLGSNKIVLGKRLNDLLDSNLQKHQKLCENTKILNSYNEKLYSHEIYFFDALDKLEQETKATKIDSISLSNKRFKEASYDEFDKLNLNLDQDLYSNYSTKSFCDDGFK
ncbi:MAG: hypothetical protein K9G11_00040 [Rickettsiaceae bacterium]|nr:hypothetical protein [Rickettsiaceae bacterium]